MTAKRRIFAIVVAGAMFFASLPFELSVYAEEIAQPEAAVEENGSATEDVTEDLTAEEDVLADDGVSADDPAYTDPEKGQEEDELLDAPEGTILSDDASSAEAVFGSDATVRYDPGDKKLTIELSADVVLNETLVLKQGSEAGGTIVIDLNGHTLKGAAGTGAEDLHGPGGVTAIEIEAARFNVEIKGPGVLSGGNGEVYEDPESGYRYGRRGADAILLTCGDISYYPPTDELEYSLTVSGGAEVKGGNGADITYDDWVHNTGTDVDELTGGRFVASAGSGGRGIAQVCTEGFDIGETASHAFEEKVFMKYLITNGSVVGGNGGSFTGGEHAFNNNAYKNNEVITDFLKKSGRSYSYIYGAIGLNAGNGGSGMEYYYGRKYLYVGASSGISGGDGGQILFSGDAALTKMTWTHNGDAGKGILSGGDIGLTNASPSLSCDIFLDDHWSKKTKDSPDVGIWIDGKVCGGKTYDT